MGGPTMPATVSARMAVAVEMNAARPTTRPAGDPITPRRCSRMGRLEPRANASILRPPHLLAGPAYAALASGAVRQMTLLLSTSAHASAERGQRPCLAG